MSFRVMARTVLQLGAELISSDSIAFYELIKNAFDAGSPRVDIDVDVRLPHDAYVSHVQHVQAEKQVQRTRRELEQAVEERKSAAARDVDATAPGADTLKHQLLQAKTWEHLLEALDAANHIDFRDTGCGMTHKDLDEVFLTIGTPSRLKSVRQNDATTVRPVLGEKGIGRLSAMRLGSRLHVESSTKDEDNWNRLDIDWRLFSHDSEALVEEIDIRPSTGRPKEDPKVSGTLVRVYGLTSRWSEAKLIDIAATEFSRLTDPFLPKLRYPLSLRFNGRPVTVPAFEKILFEHAHAVVEADYKPVSAGATFTGRINYVLRRREKTFSLQLSDLVSVTSMLPAILSNLGPFSVQLYWFNRKVLATVEGIGDKRAVQALVNRWSGGLMVFRDGFRVNPYGSADDDWLDLDRRAFASAGYKVNRKQIIGKVTISRGQNPALTDQTNRQGLRDCDEKQILISLLKHLLEAQFRTFLNQVDDELKARLPVSFDDLNERIETEDRRMHQNLDLLLEKHPEVREDAEVIGTLEASLKRIDGLMRDAQELADSFEKGRAQLVNLAGLGLMVEILAHELNRATHHALATLADTDLASLDAGVSNRLSTLSAQLKTLQKRLRVIDPLSHPGRQVKETFDLIAWVEEIISSHEAQFRRHGITCTVSVKPERTPQGMPVKMVKGMIVQIIENLFSNSVYWLKQQRKLADCFSPKIEVAIDIRSKEIRVTDNGPGIPAERKDELFQPFVTTKPPGEGKGLGLYISREIASYHGAALVLSDERTIHDDRLNTFILTLVADQK